MFAGRDEPVVEILREFVISSPRGEATILYDKGQTTSPEAALLNATAAHALDYDDVAIDGHPSVVLVLAVLAEGERLRSSGAEMIAAYVRRLRNLGRIDLARRRQASRQRLASERRFRRRGGRRRGRKACQA